MVKRAVLHTVQARSNRRTKVQVCEVNGTSVRVERSAHDVGMVISESPRFSVATASARRDWWTLPTAAGGAGAAYSRACKRVPLPAGSMLPGGRAACSMVTRTLEAFWRRRRRCGHHP